MNLIESSKRSTPIPVVNLYGFKLGEPADADSVKSHIKGFGLEPTAAMVAFYSTTNGAYLEWGIGGQEYEWMGEGGFPDYGSAPGLINLMGFEDAFAHDWQEEYIIAPDIEDEIWDMAFGEPFPGDEGVTTAVVVDNFSMEAHSDLLLGTPPAVMVSSDHGADLSCSDFVSFELYLELVIAQYGSSPERVLRNADQPKRRTSVDRPTLDQVIERVLADQQSMVA